MCIAMKRAAFKDKCVAMKKCKQTAVGDFLSLDVVV